MTPARRSAKQTDIHLQERDMIELQGGVVIVTGSSRGIGRATALKLAGRGAKVVVNCSSSLDEAEGVAEECRAVGGDGVVCQANVAEDADCKRLAQAALDRWGRIDGLVNNAGTTKFCAHGDLDGLDAADFQAIFAVNTIGPFQMIRAVATAMKAQGRGSVVNVSSVAGIHGLGSSVAYMASKGALNTMAMGLARALGPEIQINTVCPGFIAGDWLRQGMGDEAYEATKTRLETTTPLRAVNQPEDIAETITYLLGAAPKITGEIISIDAGMGILRGN